MSATERHDKQHPRYIRQSRQVSSYDRRRHRKLGAFRLRTQVSPYPYLISPPPLERVTPERLTLDVMGEVARQQQWKSEVAEEYRERLWVDLVLLSKRVRDERERAQAAEAIAIVPSADAAARRFAEQSVYWPVPRSRPFTVLRVWGGVGFAMIFGAVSLLHFSIGAGLVVMYAGLAIFALGNYAAYQVGEGNYIIGPSMSRLVGLAAAMLSVVTLTAVILR